MKKPKSLTKAYKFGPGKVRGSWWLLLTRARKHGWKGNLTGPRSGGRTYVMQAGLYALYRAGIGAPAFPPGGPSRHMLRNIRGRKHWKQAVDVSDPQGLIRAAKKAGVELHQPYASESWHIESKRRFNARKLK